MSDNASSPMRLRLRINRHDLPTTHITWAIGHSSGAYSPKALSIAQLLEQINEVIPLESDDWGLEDYAVDVLGFECLHFQDVSAVLRDGDTVEIRPLSTTDVRLRKLSGRHQISADGKHLIDGVAFGRPYVKKPGGRPAVQIPPRKRRKLIHDDDAAGEQPRLMVDDAPYETSESDQESDASFKGDEESNDFSEGGSEDAEMRDEEDAQGEAAGELSRLSPAAVEAEDLSRSKRRKSRMSTSRVDSGSLVLWESHALDLVDEDGNPFPGLYDNPLLDYYENALLESPASSGLPLSLQLQTGLDQTTGNDQPILLSNGEFPCSTGSKASDASRKTVMFRDDPTLSPEQRPPSSDSGSVEDDENDDDDSEFHPDDDIEDASTESSMSWERKDKRTRSESASASFTTHSSSSSAWCSSEDDEDEHDRSARGRTASDNIQSLEVLKRLPQPMKPPGTGSSATKTRNQRRRNKKKLQHLKRIGVLPENANNHDFLLWSSGGRDPKFGRCDGGIERSAQGENDGASEFEVRRQNLLESLNSGGVEVTSDADHQLARSTVFDDQQSGPKGDTEFQTSHETLQNDPPVTVEGDSLAPTGSTSSSQRRTKLDIQSSRRMLLASLGLRDPKKQKKNDEMQSLQKTDSNSAPALERETVVDQSRTETKMTDPLLIAGMNSTEEQTPHVNDNTWREKIILTAVECCEEGINLSTPPFPFVQRWDPQQKLPRNGRMKVNKKRKRRQIEYYQNEATYAHTLDDQDEYENDDIELNYDEPVEELSVAAPLNMDNAALDEAASNQVMRDLESRKCPSQNEGSNMEDIPAMSAGPETYVALSKLDLRPGAVIGFKQLIMTDNWQPEISDFQTARVEQLLDGDIIKMTVAEKHRQRKEKQYDDEGQRIYGKFEAPDDEDSEGVDEGLREVPFSALIEAKLVRAALQQLDQDNALDGENANVEPTANSDPNLAAADDTDHPLDETDVTMATAEEQVESEIHPDGSGPAPDSIDKNNEMTAEPEPSGNAASMTHQQTVQEATTTENVTVQSSPRFRGLDWERLSHYSTPTESRSPISHISEANGNEFHSTATNDASAQTRSNNGDPAADAMSREFFQGVNANLRDTPDRSPADQLAKPRESDGSSSAVPGPISVEKAQEHHSLKQNRARAAPAAGNRNVEPLSSDDDLPSPSKIFSMLFESSAPDENDPGSTTMVPARLKLSDDHPSPSTTATAKVTAKATTTTTTTTTTTDTTSSRARFPPSGMPLASRAPDRSRHSDFVDLTQSSDDALTCLQQEPPTTTTTTTTTITDDGDGLGSGLPRGPGWVPKSTSTRRSGLAARRKTSGGRARRF